MIRYYLISWITVPFERDKVMISSYWYCRFHEGAEMNFGAENDCKCGSNGTCDPCSCK
jgi:hypothetical protein